MNGEPLPPDHGHPVRVLVPSWVGIASIKWVGDIEVSRQPLFSPWNTTFYRLFGPAHPEGGSVPLTRQTLKSAFELASGATFPAGRSQVLRGRSWSGAGPVARVDVSTDGGASWRPARLDERPRPDTWTRWSVDWKPRTRGRPSCWPAPPTPPAAPSRTSPCSTPRATCSTRWYGTR